MLKILLDSRETQLISILNDRDLDKYTNLIIYQIQQLDIGDIHICFEDKCFIIERKSLNDLLSSIKDGRYHEQKSRLLSSSNEITYIIEGDDIVSSINQRNQNILSSVYIHSLYRDNIKVVFTKDINQTATFILTLCTKILDKPKYFLEKKETPDYIDTIKIKTKKIQNITPENCYIMQLGQIPSISVKVAKNIQMKYPKMRDLISALNESQNKIELLCEIDLIGKDKANKILQYLDYIDDKN